MTGDTNDVTDIFVHDTEFDITNRISLDTSLEQANGPSYNPTISADGSFVVFNSISTSLVSDDTNEVSDIFLHDNTFSTDSTPPDVTINQAASQDDSTTVSPINFTAFFSEPI